MPYLKPIAASLLLLGLCGTAKAQQLIPYVQTMAGTADATTPSAIKHSARADALRGNTIPAVTVPFAMTQWTPQTQYTEVKCVAPYYYTDTLFYGIRGSHWLSGSCTQDYGSFTIRPVTSTLKTQNKGWRFSHTDEFSAPNEYRIHLKQAGLSMAVTSSQRCGMVQFTMQKADSLFVLISPNSDFNEGFAQINTHTAEAWGYNPAHRIYQGWGKPAGFSGYFYISFSVKPARGAAYTLAGPLKADSAKNQPGLGVYAGFKLHAGDVLLMRIGTSFTSVAEARKNLQTELAGKTYAQLKAQCTARWQQALGQIKVQGTEADKRMFYTSFYHALQLPRLFNDADGSYPRFAGSYQIQKLLKGNYYDDFSMWDVYRAQLPLFEILQPRFMGDVANSLVIKGSEAGWMPIFPCWNNYTSEMIGDHATSVISSAYLKGIRNFNIAEAYRLLRQNAFDTPASFANYADGKGRRALQSYLKYHYIPLEDSVAEAYHKREQVSRTMEYAYDDYALACFARALGKQTDADTLLRRSLYYRNVIDARVGYARGRMVNRNWDAGFNPDKKQSYITEGTPRQFTFYVPHDVPGLSHLLGGTKQLELKLDSVFALGEYWHGNEPGHQIPFMYNYTRAPWKTQRIVRQILANEYALGPGGLGGNDDAGQMSAWYIFASMGFYPLNPVSGQYLLCSPLFSQVNIALPQGKHLQIICHKAGKNAQYISKVLVNGHVLKQNYLTYAQLMQGGVVQFYLQSKPCLNWGNQPGSQPLGVAL